MLTNVLCAQALYLRLCLARVVCQWSLSSGIWPVEKTRCEELNREVSLKNRTYSERINIKTSDTLVLCGKALYLQLIFGYRGRTRISTLDIFERLGVGVVSGHKNIEPILVRDGWEVRRSDLIILLCSHPWSLRSGTCPYSNYKLVKKWHTRCVQALTCIWEASSTVIARSAMGFWSRKAHATDSLCAQALLVTSDKA